MTLSFIAFVKSLLDRETLVDELMEPIEEQQRRYPTYRLRL